MRVLHPPISRTRGLVLAAVSALAVVAAMTPAVTSSASATTKPGHPQESGAGEKPPDYDARRDGAAGEVLAARGARLAAKPTPGVKALRARLGVQGIVTLDPLTRTPRQVARTDGLLTGPSSRTPAAVALGYIRSQPGVFRLTPADIAGLRLRKDYVDVAGTHHLSFVQSVRGVPVFGNGLKAHVTRDGRLVQVDGSPVPDLPANVGAPDLSAAQARAAAVQDVHGSSRTSVARQSAAPDRMTRFSGGDQAKLVLFQTLGGLRLAWQTITLQEGYLHVIDADTGRTLLRRNLTQSDTGLVWRNYPGARNGGRQKRVDLSAEDWLPNGSPALRGNVAHVYEDLNDDDTAQPSEEIRPDGKRKFEYRLHRFRPKACVPAFVCTWNPQRARSWKTNASQNGVQMMFFLGNWHDHLQRAPIGFTRRAGNFEAVDDDAVQANAIDGANTAHGLPDRRHVDNANMTTPPDGMTPRMQMYLFHRPSTAFPEDDPFIAANSGDSADILYHEYTHGLSNRLVVDADGVSTLGDVQAGGMGEAWSDWYAMDYLAKQGLEHDTAKPGEMRVGKYVTWGSTIRTQPLDCPVGKKSKTCPGTPSAGGGGYTYGDFGHVSSRGPEVHADGEIWSETLWDLRAALGSRLTESLLTRAMELSPANPSYLDERNAILQADQVVNEGRKRGAIWRVFAHRGMGFFAGSIDGDDPAPVEDFSTPPSPSSPRGTLFGSVSDSETLDPVAGATVALGGHASGFAGDYAATTDADGHYTIKGIIPGTYPKVFARGPGYDVRSATISIAARQQVQDWTLRRDWAASSGGGSITAFTPPDRTDFGCGPGRLIDQSQTAGWRSVSPMAPDGADPQPKSAVIKLPAAVDVTEISVNPSATCGDAGSASTGDYRVETSTDGSTWTVADEGHFGPSDRHANRIRLAPGSTAAVKFVRWTMISTQVADLGGTCPGPFDGCDFMDSTEVAVYGIRSAG